MARSEGFCSTTDPATSLNPSHGDIRTAVETFKQALSSGFKIDLKSVCQRRNLNVDSELSNIKSQEKQMFKQQATNETDRHISGTIINEVVAGPVRAAVAEVLVLVSSVLNKTYPREQLCLLLPLPPSGPFSVFYQIPLFMPPFFLLFEVSPLL